MFKDENLGWDDTFLRASNNTLVNTHFGIQEQKFNSPTGQPMPIFSVEREEYKKKAAEQSRIQRIQEVRKQEQLISRQGTNKKYKEELKKQQQEKELYNSYLDYQAKLKRFEQLKQQKLQELKDQQQNAIMTQQKNLEIAIKEKESAEKRVRDKKLANDRGREAMKKRVEEINQISNFENTRRNIEKKNQVREQEAQISHLLAQDFREKEKQRQQREEIERRLEEEKRTYTIDKYGNKVDTCMQTGFEGSIDYTNT